MSEDFTPDALEAAGALHPAADPGYSWPTDPLVAERLEHWRDLKVGVIIHWGIYATIGQGGSWSLHRGHLGDFTDPPLGFRGTDADYHTWYYDQARTFTGTDFEAEEWAAACAEAGMKYAVVTSKHHDGFAMYDTKYSNLKSTAEWAGLRRDVFGEFMESFRAHGLETGVYFSKADWAHPDYWDLAQPVRDRFHNYDIAAEPRRWQRFVEFTHDQIEELLTRYGPMAVLWLDAGWVRDPDEPIGIDDIAARARELQPGILVVDREVHGPNEDYRTPEQELLGSDPGHPWEACITLTRSWCSLRKDDPTKPTGEVVRNLLQIVSRGGNYLIGIGPDATGAMSVHIRRSLTELGQWLTLCGEGIYASRSPRVEIAAHGDLEWYVTERAGAFYAYGTAGSRDVPADTLTVQIPVAAAEIATAGGWVALEVTRHASTSTMAIPAGATPYAAAVRLSPVEEPR